MDADPIVSDQCTVRWSPDGYRLYVRVDPAVDERVFLAAQDHLYDNIENACGARPSYIEWGQDESPLPYLAITCSEMFDVDARRTRTAVSTAIIGGLSLVRRQKEWEETGLVAWFDEFSRKTDPADDTAAAHAQI